VHARAHVCTHRRPRGAAATPPVIGFIDSCGDGPCFCVRTHFCRWQQSSYGRRAVSFDERRADYDVGRPAETRAEIDLFSARASHIYDLYVYSTRSRIALLCLGFWQTPRSPTLSCVPYFKRDGETSTAHVTRSGNSHAIHRNRDFSASKTFIEMHQNVTLNVP